MPITENTDALNRLERAIGSFENTLFNLGAVIERNTQAIERIEQLMIDVSQQEETAHTAVEKIANFVETFKGKEDEFRSVIVGDRMDDEHEHIREASAPPSGQPTLCVCVIGARAWDSNTGICGSCKRPYKAKP